MRLLDWNLFFSRKNCTFWSFWLFLRRLCLIYISPGLFSLFSYCMFYVTCILCTGTPSYIRTHYLFSTLFYKTAQFDLSLTNYLSKSEIALFPKKTLLLSLLTSSPYTYPWNIDDFEKGLFCEEIWVFFWLKMAVLWGVSEDVVFWGLEHDFGDFRSTPVLWGFLETVFEGCCKTLLSRIWV